MDIYHTSPEKILKIDDAYNRVFGECLFFSSTIYQMSDVSKYVHKLQLNDDEIIRASEFFYEDGCEKLSDILKEIMQLVDCSEEDAQGYLDESLDIYNNDNICIEDKAEISWKIQKFMGLAAKKLGYRAAAARDEQGVCYIVPMSGYDTSLQLVSEIAQAD